MSSRRRESGGHAKGLDEYNSAGPSDVRGGADPSLRCGGSYLRAEDGSVRSTESLSLDQDAFDPREGLVGPGEVEQADLDTAQHEVG